MKNRWFHLLATLLGIASPAPAQDADLPSPFDPTVVTPMLQNSPFTRAVNLSDSLILTGIAYIDGKPVATLLDKETKKHYVVSEQPNPQGWTLQEASQTTNVKKAQAKIAIGGEVVSIRYDEEAMTPEAMKKMNERSSRSDRGPPPPGGGDDRYRRSDRGPSDEDRKRYESLSDKAREKFRDTLREKFNDPKFRNAPEEERRNAVKAEFDKIEKEDKGGKK
jgi:hypothetical protein